MLFEWLSSIATFSKSEIIRQHPIKERLDTFRDFFDLVYAELNYPELLDAAQ
jgi:hypothetical protein